MHMLRLHMNGVAAKVTRFHDTDGIWYRASRQVAVAKARLQPQAEPMHVSVSLAEAQAVADALAHPECDGLQCEPWPEVWRRSDGDSFS